MKANREPSSRSQLPKRTRPDQQERRGSEVEGGRTSGAVVVDVDDGDTSHTELVEDTLTTGRVTVDITSGGVLDVIVGEASVDKGLNGTFETEDRVVLVTRLGEGGHTYTDDVSFACGHFGSVGVYMCG